MNKQLLLEGLQLECPVGKVAYTMPSRAGLVVVDEVNGFCTPGMGPLAPPQKSAQVDQMVEKTDKLAREFVGVRFLRYPPAGRPRAAVSAAL